MLLASFNAAGNDTDRLSVLKRSNAMYEQSLTDKAVSRRSKLSEGGLLDRALMELQAPSSKKSRSAALKETRAFLDQFSSTVQYFQQLDDSSHLRTARPFGRDCSRLHSTVEQRRRQPIGEAH